MMGSLTVKPIICSSPPNMFPALYISDTEGEGGGRGGDEEEEEEGEGEGNSEKKIH